MISPVLGVMLAKKYLINPKIKVESIFHAYMIDPGTDKDGEEYLSNNKRRWGSDSWTKHLKSIGKKYGANFKATK